MDAGTPLMRTVPFTCWEGDSMTDSTRPSTRTGHKARSDTFLESLSNAFDLDSQEEKRKLQSSLQRLVRDDSRRYLRRLYLVPVTIDDVHSGIARNISVSGVFIRTCASLSVGQEIKMDFPFLGPDESTEMIGEVVWRNRAGVGVQFTMPPSQALKKAISKGS